MLRNESEVADKKKERMTTEELETLKSIDKSLKEIVQVIGYPRDSYQGRDNDAGLVNAIYEAAIRLKKLNNNNPFQNGDWEKIKHQYGY